MNPDERRTENACNRSEKVTVIPADPQMTEKDFRKKHLRVAPYCRVSTDSEEQLGSYKAQIEYYTERIGAQPEVDDGGYVCR